MEESRDRKSAVFDKKKSILNYMKMDDKNEIKKDRINRLTSGQNYDLKNIKQQEFESDLPKPPQFSEAEKVYSSTKDTNKLYIHERATIINNFDQYKPIDMDLSLINLKNYLAKFDEDEISNITLKDIITFDLKEFDNIKNKLNDLLKIASVSKDSEIINFLNEKIKNVDLNTQNIKCLLSNFDKVEDFIIMNETMKFFFNN